MAIAKIYELNILLKNDEIVLELNTFNPGGGQRDKIENELLRVEMRVAEIFYKLINFIRYESHMFKKEDFQLLGEILGKIIFSGQLGRMFMDSLFKEAPPECLRIYLEFDPASTLTTLPWEYMQVWPTDKVAKLGEQSIYLSANENSRFQLVRRFKKNVDPPPFSESINVVLIICNGDNNNENITSLGSDSITTVFENLRKKDSRFNYRILNNPEKDNFTTELIAAVKSFDPEGNSIPPFMIHYFGHSRIEAGEGQVVFKTSTLEATWVKDTEFADFFDKSLLTLQSNKNNDTGNDLVINVPSIVLLQSCDSGKVGDFMNGKGVALAMCKKNIPAVIGMQNEIDTISSSQFSRVFYESLLKGADVAEAITNGRYFLGCKYNIGSAADIFGNNEFGSPVLFINTAEPIALIKKTIVQDSNESGNITRKKCSNCKAENDPDAKFCKNCSRPFLDQKVERPVSEEEQPTEATRSTANINRSPGTEKTPAKPLTDRDAKANQQTRESQSAGKI